MSRHIPRSQRWVRRGPTELVAAGGLHVFYQKRAWWADVSYRLMLEKLSTDAGIAWEAHTDRLGPFKRERNAQVEAERHAIMLKNRYGTRIEMGARSG
jgi:hypothetical protein